MFWRLPPGSLVLDPVQCRKAHHYRDLLNKLYESRGYSPIDLPLLEYVQSATESTNQNIRRVPENYFQFYDPMSGEMVRFRSDATQQVGQYFASLNESVPARYSYFAQVVKSTNLANSHSRTPVQMGTELIDDDESVASEAEAVCLLLESLKLVGIEEVHLCFGHAGLTQLVISQLHSNDRESALKALMERRVDYFDAKVSQSTAPSETAAYKLASALCLAHGPVEKLLGKDIDSKLWETSNGKLEHLLELVKSVLKWVQVQRELGNFLKFSFSYDLAELYGKGYHDGCTFTAFTADFPKAIMKGGRYSINGEKPIRAVGFSANLNDLLQCGSEEFEPNSKGVYTVPIQDTDLDTEKAVTKALENGWVVIRGDAPSHLNALPIDTRKE